MKLEEYARYDGLGLAELVARRDVTPRELGALALAGIEKVNPRLNAVIETFPERLQKLAPLSGDGGTGPFGGVPLLVKDFPIEKGVKGEMGCQLFAGFAPDRDSELMLRLRRAGFVNLGRTASSELGLAALTRSRQSGITRNPWDPSRSTAGSTGGGAAAAAAGIVPIVQGGDGGGSIRNPASFCGLLGLKPSRGRISAGPDEGDSLGGMAISFVLTRSLRDCAAALDAVAGPGIGDPYEIAPPVLPYTEEISRPSGRLKIVFTARAWSGLHLDSELDAGVRSVAKLLEGMGHEVSEQAPAFDYEEFLAAQIELWCGHTAYGISALAEAQGRKPGPENLQTTSWAVYEAGRRLSTTRFLAAEAFYNTVTRQLGDFFRETDVLLTPTCTVPPLPLDAHNLDAPRATVKDLFDHLAPIETFTALFNATGQPAMSLPLCWSKSGLPLGMQLVGRSGDEATLFRLAAALEQALPWSDRRPPIHVAA
jgi:amidase